MQNDNIKDYISIIVNSDSKRARAAALRDLLAAIPGLLYSVGLYDMAEAVLLSEAPVPEVDRFLQEDLGSELAAALMWVTESEAFGY